MTLAYKCMDIVEIGVKAYPIAIDTFFRHHMFCVRSPYQLKRDPISKFQKGESKPKLLFIERENREES